MQVKGQHSTRLTEDDHDKDEHVDDFQVELNSSHDVGFWAELEHD